MKEPTILKVELVKVHALHQVSKGLWLKRSQSRVTDSPVGIKNSIKYSCSNKMRPKGLKMCAFHRKIQFLNVRQLYFTQKALANKMNL